MGAWDKVSSAAGGGIIGGAIAGAPGQAVGMYQGYKSDGNFIDKNNPWVQGPRDARAAKKESNALAQDLYSKTGMLNQTLNSADTDYAKSFGSKSKDYLKGAEGLVNTYLGKIGKLEGDAQTQANDARATYTNSILPEYKNAMGMAKTNASQAMSLAEASDPNNPIMTAIRDLYNKQGEGVRKQGQQDYGILSALGAQAAQGQFGAAGPMTAGQQGQIYAANQSQAGDAYAKAQQRMFDLQQQGLDRGFDQSNQIYQFGQDAQGRYSDSIKNLQGGENAFYDQQGRFRDELGGYAGDQMGVNAGLNADRFNIGMMGSDIDKGNAYAGTGRDQQALNQLYGVQQQGINNELAAKLANQQAKGQFASSLISSGAKAYAGGA